MNFRPLYERIAVEVIQSDEKTKSGLLIPDTAKEKPMHGKVVALGKGYRNDKGEYSALEVKIGDTVIFGKWAGTEVKISDKEYLIMKESDVMVVINN